MADAFIEIIVYYDLYACNTVTLAQQEVSKKGYYVLMGIVMDCFCWVTFDLLQTLFGLGPQGPKG